MSCYYIHFFPSVFYCVPIHFRPTQQHARARRTPYASADNDGTSCLYMNASQLRVRAFHFLMLYDGIVYCPVECMNLPPEDLIQNGDPIEDKNKEEQ